MGIFQPWKVENELSHKNMHSVYVTVAQFWWTAKFMTFLF